MPTVRLVFLTFLTCGLLLTAIKLGRSYSLAIIPALIACTAVVILIAVGVTQRQWTAIVGGTVGLLVYIALAIVMAYYPETDGEVFLTSDEYNRLLRRHMIEGASLALLSLAIGAAIGYCGPGILAAFKANS